MQGKLFQRCSGVTARHWIHFSYKKSMKYSGHSMGIDYLGSKFSCVNYQNLMLLTSLNTKKTLMDLFLFTNSAQRELVSICP